MQVVVRDGRTAVVIGIVVLALGVLLGRDAGVRDVRLDWGRALAVGLGVCPESESEMENDCPCGVRRVQLVEGLEVMESESVRSSCYSFQSGYVLGHEVNLCLCCVSEEESESERGVLVVRHVEEESEMESGLGFFLVWRGHAQVENVISVGTLSGVLPCPSAVRLG